MSIASHFQAGDKEERLSREILERPWESRFHK